MKTILSSDSFTKELLKSTLRKQSHFKQEIELLFWLKIFLVKKFFNASTQGISNMFMGLKFVRGQLTLTSFYFTLFTAVDTA